LAAADAELGPPKVRRRRRRSSPSSSATGGTRTRRRRPQKTKILESLWSLKENNAKSHQYLWLSPKQQDEKIDYI